MAVSKSKKAYRLHNWMAHKYEALRNVSAYHTKERQKQLEKEVEDFNYLTQEYMHGIVSEEEYKKARGKHRNYIARIQYWISVWEERVVYLDELIEYEYKIAESFAKRSGKKGTRKKKSV